jgi:hypothetical protein
LFATAPSDVGRHDAMLVAFKKSQHIYHRRHVVFVWVSVISVVWCWCGGAVLRWRCAVVALLWQVGVTTWHLSWRMVGDDTFFDSSPTCSLLNIPSQHSPPSIPSQHSIPAFHPSIPSQHSIVFPPNISSQHSLPTFHPSIPFQHSIPVLSQHSPSIPSRHCPFHISSVHAVICDRPWHWRLAPWSSVMRILALSRCHMRMLAIELYREDVGSIDACDNVVCV